MFRPQSFFNNIPCPVESGKCGLVYCLFSHDTPPTPAPAPVTTPAQQQQHRQPQAPPIQEGLRPDGGLNTADSTPGRDSVSSGSMGGVALDMEDIELTSSSGEEVNRQHSSLRVKRRKVDRLRSESGLASVNTGTIKTGSGSSVGRRRVVKAEEGEAMEGVLETGKVKGKGEEKGVQAESGAGVFVGAGKPSTAPLALQRQQQQLREQQKRMASVPGVQSVKSKVSGQLQKPQAQGKVDRIRGAASPLISRSMTPTAAPSTAPSTASSSSTSSSKTVIPTSPTLTYAKATSTKPTPAPAKSTLLVPASVARCSAKWGTRTQLLTLLHGEYVRLYQATQQDPMIITLAVDEEADVAKTKGAVYPNVMKNRITALKKADAKSAEWVRKRMEIGEKRKGELRKGLEELAGNGVPAVKGEVASAGGKGQSSSVGSEIPAVKVPQGESGTAATAGRGVTISASATSTNTPPPPPSDIVTDPSQYKPLTTGLSPQEEVSSLSPLIHPPSTLTKYSYILTPLSPSDIATSQSGVSASQGWEVCDRCGSRFQIFPGRRESDGALTSGGKCTYHWGRAMLPPRSLAAGLGAAERSYTCCKQTVGTSAGCVTGDSHVFKVGDVKRLAGQWQWVQTYPNNPLTTDEEVKTNGNGGKVKVSRAFALDCEMCYTTLGMEMVRVTVVDFPGGEVAIDALVRPKGDILDLNTRFSGVSAKEYISAKSYSPGNGTSGLGIFSSPEAARDEVLRLLRFGVHKDEMRPNIDVGGAELAPREERMEIDTEEDGVAVLIGHALENDLNVLRLCHPYIVDTCIHFPHSRGFPARNKLSWVAEKYLKWRIQSQDIVMVPGEGGEEAIGVVKGHDSAIDARCAGELVRWKIKDGLRSDSGGSTGVGKFAGARKGRGAAGVGRGAGSVGIRFDGVAAYVARERDTLEGAPGSKTTVGNVNPEGEKNTGLEKRKRGVFTESDGEGGDVDGGKMKSSGSGNALNNTTTARMHKGSSSLASASKADRRRSLGIGISGFGL